MIRVRSFKILRFYLKADSIMNEQVFNHGYKRMLFPNPIRTYLRRMRIAEYLNFKWKENKLWLPVYLLFRVLYLRSMVRCGFDIQLHTFGYGVRIGHCCGIIINGATTIGNYCCIYRCSVADGNQKVIGNNVLIGTNTVITHKVNIADGCSIAAMSLVNKNITMQNQLWGGYRLIA